MVSDPDTLTTPECPDCSCQLCTDLPEILATVTATAKQVDWLVQQTRSAFEALATFQATSPLAIMAKRKQGTAHG